MELRNSNCALGAPLQGAVLFLVFNRPDTTARVFDAIREARPPRLYVAADGPRHQKKAEVGLVNEVRKIATNVDWPCELKILFREENQGCKYAVSGAIDWFFEHEEQGIILEDDCLPSQSFFWFCEEMLDRYANDLRIGQVCGFNSVNLMQQESDYFFSNLGSIWGWATWRRAWKNYDINMPGWPAIRDGDKFRGVYIEQSLKNERYKAYEATYNHKIDTWDYQWAYARSLNNQLCIFPSVSLIKQLGFDARATHTKNTPKWLKQNEHGDIDMSLMRPPHGVLPSWKYEKEIVRQRRTKFLMRIQSKLGKLASLAVRNFYGK